MHNDATFALTAAYAAFACSTTSIAAARKAVGDGASVLRALEGDHLAKLHAAEEAAASRAST